MKICNCYSSYSVTTFLRNSINIPYGTTMSSPDKRVLEKACVVHAKPKVWRSFFLMANYIGRINLDNLVESPTYLESLKCRYDIFEIWWGISCLEKQHFEFRTFRSEVWQ